MQGEDKGWISCSEYDFSMSSLKYVGPSASISGRNIQMNSEVWGEGDYLNIPCSLLQSKGLIINIH